MVPLSCQSTPHSCSHPWGVIGLWRGCPQRCPRAGRAEPCPTDGVPRRAGTTRGVSGSAELGCIWGAGSQGPPAALLHPLAPCSATGMERASPWAENSHGPYQGCRKPQPRWGADTRDPDPGRGHIPHGSACAAGSILGAVRGPSAAFVARCQQEARDPLPSPHTGKREGMGGSQHRGTRAQPPPVTAARLPPPSQGTASASGPGCRGCQDAAPCPSPRAGSQRRQLSLTPLRPSLLPSLSLRSSAPLHPSIRPPACLSVCPFLSAGLGRSGWPGAGGCAPPGRNSASLSCISLFFLPSSPAAVAI